MTRFLYLSDTHFGTEPMKYTQQEAHPKKLPDLIEVLRKIIADEQIEFVLHGGDMIDATTDENITKAAALFKLPVPVYLCLGNHDLTEPDALQRWLKRAPELFPGQRPEFTVVTSDCNIHVAPNHWSEEPYWWNQTQDAQFKEDQLVQLEKNLQEDTDKIHILLTHSSVYDLPHDQTGHNKPIDPPNPPFQKCIQELGLRHKNLRCVLGGHTHFNMRIEAQGIHYVTASAFVETPFELKIFEASPEGLSMKTISLADRLDFRASYDFNKTHVQGRGTDRGFSITK